MNNEADIGVSVFNLTKKQSIGELPKLCPGSLHTAEKIDVLVPSGTATSLLSQDPAVQSSLPLSFVDDQMSDPECRQITAFLRQKVLPDDEVQAKYLVKMADRFAVVDSVLYYVYPKRSHSKRAVIPKYLSTGLMEQFHCGPFAGHFSVQRTYSALRSKFWWDGMFTDVQRFCKNCPPCTTRRGTEG